MMRLLCTILFFIFGLQTVCIASKPHNNICMNAVKRAARAVNIPADVLGAVALTETGIKRGGEYAPWPWAINVAGKGYIFNTRDEAIRATIQHINDGKTSVDIGCMQMNWRWHKDKFGSSVVTAFDPYNNVLQAARYIKSHYQQYGNWTKAIGRYHSGTSSFAKLYIAKAQINRNLMRKNMGLQNIPNDIQIANAVDTTTETASIPNKNNMPKPIISLDNLPAAPELQGKLLSMSPGALIDFEQVGERLVTLPESPTPLINRPTRPFIDMRN
jgi:hypothetical protein